LLLLAAAPALAQRPLEPARLPADTIFYLAWRGTASLGAAGNTNALLRLWNDAEFAPSRQALLEAFYASAKKNQTEQSLKPEDLAQFLSLLENPFVIGVAGNADLSQLASKASPEGAAPSWPFTFFAILDASGKEAIVQKLRGQVLEGPDKPSVSSYAFGSTTVEEFVGAKQTYYLATVGPYTVRADQKAVIEDLIGRLRSTEKPATSLELVAEYRSAQSKIDSGAVAEFYVRFPDFRKFPTQSKESFDPGAFIRTLHVERLHVAVGSLSLQGEAARFRGAALGDTSPGSVFDLVGTSTPAFGTLPAAPAGAAYYSAARINLTALYRIVHSALEEALTPKQRMNMELAQALAENQIEMKIPEVLELLGGEFASLTTSGDFNPTSQVYAVTIQKQPQLLKLIRNLLHTQIASEEHEGDATYLKLASASAAASPPARGQAANPPSQGYYLALTPQTLLVGPKKETLRDAVARLAAKDPPAASLATDQGFRRARARFPETLSSLGYLDLSRVQWEELIDQFSAGLKKNPSSSPSAAVAVETLKKALPAIRRYLHTISNSSWKNPDGVYFDGYVE
jgi:hypothetical protein